MVNEAAEVFERIRDAFAPHYRLERPLGVGGMAVLLLAHELKHDRRVAIKVLRSELVPTVGAARFEREIRVAARLTHPNILPLLDSGDFDGTPYYIMPFVEGESLRARLERLGALPLAEALALAAEAADALNYAHAAGIVHRDIKPENILLLNGHAVVADFGIARAISASALGEEVTSAGIILGTPAYMSPEQAAGDDQLDGRSDVYSLATVVFEMLSGSVPFTASTTRALIARRFVEAAPRLSSRNPGIPEHIDAAIAAALEIEPSGRPPTAAAFAASLGAPAELRAATPAATGAVPAEPLVLPATTISGLGLPSIAVLPFVNLTSDPENEFFSDGITEEVMSALSRLRTVKVAARTSSFAFKGRNEDARVIAERLRVTNILAGSVRRAGSRVRVKAQLIDATTGFELWSDQIDREFEDAFAIQDDIARAIAGALRVTLLDVRTTAATPIAGQVYELYLRGRFALNKRTEADLRRAADYFSEAAQADPEFALAHAGLADAWLMLGVYGAERAPNAMPKARAAAERSIEIDPSLPEAHATLGAVSALFDWNWSGAEEAFRRAVALGPRYPTAYQWNAMNHLLPRARFDDARIAIERARSLDPLSLVIATSVGVVHYLSGDIAGGVRALQQALELDPSFTMANYFLGGALRDAGDFEGAAVAFRAAIAQSGGSPEMVAGLAQTLARSGDVDGARAAQRELADLSSRRYVSACLHAQVHAALDETDLALASLERAFTERDPELVYLGVRPAYASLREHARFAAVRSHVQV
ncbi:MAG TPA: protein kinase [Gemmatimonadaceae bacterium]|nr:protein kinase [Gemmatimonadaceae bacterium]